MDHVAFSKLSDEALVRLGSIIGDPKRGIPPLIPISRSAWFHGVKHGTFPQPVRFGSRFSAWRAGDIRKLVSHPA